MAIEFRKSTSSPTATDAGNRMTQGRAVSKTIQAALFTTNENAVWKGRMQLQKESYPFAMLTVSVNRDLFQLQVGDCFRLSYDQYGISNMVCRVLQVEEESLDSEKITIHAMEDIFSVANLTTEYTDPVDNTGADPDYSLTAFTHQRVVEAPYVLSGTLRVIPIACRETNMDLGFNLYISMDGGSSYLLTNKSSNLRPFGTLAGAYSEDTYTIDEEVGIAVDFVEGASLLENVSWSEVFAATRNMALLGDEIISFQSITPIFGTLYKLEGIIRGRFGTQKEAHGVGEEIYFINMEIGLIDHTEILLGAARKYKLVPYNIKYEGEIADATPIDLTAEGVCSTPYIPTNFLANGSNSTARYATDTVLTWSPRYRGKGAGIGAPGVVLADADREGLFEIEVWVSGVKKRTTTAIDAATWTYTSAMNISDNGSLAAVVDYKITNYLSTFFSEQATVTCKRR